MPRPLVSLDPSAADSCFPAYELWLTEAHAPLPANLTPLTPDSLGRPRALGPAGQAVSMSVARASGARALAWAEQGSVGVDLECLGPSPALEAASASFLAGERAWADRLPVADRWRRHLLLWTAKEALLKALGQGFAFGLDQVELEPDPRQGLALRSLCGSGRLAQGWRIDHQTCHLAGRQYLVAVAVG